MFVLAPSLTSSLETKGLSSSKPDLCRQGAAHRLSLCLHSNFDCVGTWLGASTSLTTASWRALGCLLSHSMPYPSPGFSHSTFETGLQTTPIHPRDFFKFKFQKRSFLAGSASPAGLQQGSGNTQKPSAGCCTVANIHPPPL